ncbi:hypothetical protein ARTHRO9V_280366 [Arthrobacter sp. 9V]|nr:hypothetical protein ARTHRO9V_280366 [Arthrobacter sp. 9V]
MTSRWAPEIHAPPWIHTTVGSGAVVPAGLNTSKVEPGLYTTPSCVSSGVSGTYGVISSIVACAPRSKTLRISMAEGHGVADSASATTSTSRIASSSFRSRVVRFRGALADKPLWAGSLCFVLAWIDSNGPITHSPG